VAGLYAGKIFPDKSGCSAYPNPYPSALSQSIPYTEKIQSL
jgi:hypothetical protein